MRRINELFPLYSPHSFILSLEERAKERLRVQICENLRRKQRRAWKSEQRGAWRREQRQPSSKGFKFQELKR
jgi:hypothetical protein